MNNGIQRRDAVDGKDSINVRIEGDVCQNMSMVPKSSSLCRIGLHASSDFDGPRLIGRLTSESVV